MLQIRKRIAALLAVIKRLRDENATLREIAHDQEYHISRLKQQLHTARQQPSVKLDPIILKNIVDRLSAELAMKWAGEIHAPASLLKKIADAVLQDHRAFVTDPSYIRGIIDDHRGGLALEGSITLAIHEYHPSERFSLTRAAPHEMIQFTDFPKWHEANYPSNKGGTRAAAEYHVTSKPIFPM